MGKCCYKKSQLGILFSTSVKKLLGYPTSIVPLESVAIKDSLTYEAVPIEIFDH